MRTTHERMPSRNRLASLLLALLLALGMGGAVAQDAQNQDAAQDQTQNETQNQDAENQDGAQNQTQNQDAQSQDPDAAGGEQAVIELGEGETITANEFQVEFERAMRSLAARQGVPYTDQTRALFDRFRADFLNQLAIQEALLREAEERGVTVNDEDVQAQIDQARESAGGDEAFQQALQEFGFDSEEAYRESVREGMIAQQVVDEYRNQVEVTDQEIQTFYDENQDLFGDQTLEQVRPQVEQQLVNERLNQQFEDLRTQYGIEVFPERLPGDAEGLSRGDLETNEPGDTQDPEGNLGDGDAPADQQDGAQQDGAQQDGAGGGAQQNGVGDGAQQDDGQQDDGAQNDQETNEESDAQ